MQLLTVIFEVIKLLKEVDGSKIAIFFVFFVISRVKSLVHL